MCVIKIADAYEKGIPVKGECWKVMRRVNVYQNAIMLRSVFIKGCEWKLEQWVEAQTIGEPYRNEMVGIMTWLTKEAADAYMEEIYWQSMFVTSQLVVAKCEYEGVVGLGKIAKNMIGQNLNAEVLVVDRLRVMELV